ncbi:MAG: permease [Candidatus Delongbacteria bacterium]
MNTFTDTLYYFLFIMAELTVLFLAISTLVALLLIYIPHNMLRKYINRKGFGGYFMGTVLGSLTPFCACSTIPMTLGLLNAGASFGPVMSFVISSPLLNPIIIIMIATLMGLKASILYFAVTFIGSMLFGYILEITGGKTGIKKIGIRKNNAKISNITDTNSFLEKLKKAFSTGWSDYRGVFVYLLIGVGIGAGIYGYLPSDFVIKIAGPDNFFAIPVAATVGVPMYIRAETAIPIGIALLGKGMSIGAVIALIIGGAGMAIPEMVMLSGIFKKKLVAAIVSVIWLTAVIGGFIFNLL